MTENTNTENNSTELAVVDAELSPTSLIEAFRDSDAAVYSTIQAETFADKLTVIKALANAKKLDDNLDKPFELTDWVAQAVDVVQDNGTLTPSVRVVLITKDGSSYDCVSEGIAKALSTWQAVLGHPSQWESAVKVKAVREKGRRGFYYMTLVLA